MSDHLRWVRVRQELYKKVKNQVLNRLGKASRELEIYRQEYDRIFEGKWQTWKNEDFLQEIALAKIVLVGDFHALLQSQKAFLRLLKNRRSTAPVAIGLECFYQKDQAHLDAWLNGKISEKDFLRLVKWRENWGFEWEHYKGILKYAQKNRIPVIALNIPIPLKSRGGLIRRDRAAATALIEWIKKNSQFQIYVLYGDLHLAPGHLPQQLIKKRPELEKQIRVVHQNPERIYFQLLRKSTEHQVDVVRLSRKGDYALVSVPPWVKWQNYLLFLEQSFDRDLDEELELTDHLQDYVKIISEEFGGILNESDFADLSVYCANDEAFWVDIEEHLSPVKERFLEALIEEERSFYLPELKRCYLGRLTVNHSAGLAMAFVHSRLSGQKISYFQMPGDFTRLIWAEAIQYFGSKLINPKRKTDTVEDMRLALETKSSDGVSKDAIKLALLQKMMELMVITGRGKPKLVPVQKKKEIYIAAAGLLGGLMGERLYHAYRKKLVSKAVLLNLLHKKWDGEAFQANYYEIAELIESLPESFRSKREKI